ncbi:EF-hand domain-containing protein [Streptomyces collinus]|uniref:EF hand repeat-containing protein n=1 Tax=Streptomyces collinus (strain DSM 40733 / Tue 365) TaxID=1214242 RepID=S5UJA2_STRC3|nr:EF-hand domain-containing protein [Streptomyces collinus]AGS66883.1 EF hand repeat-containing protein [Streptomyces collinus Tu 365]AGS73811.1 EF hand repeat-containing protein [Streptomyces collinus Tu 365]
MATATTDPISVKLDQLFTATDTDGDGYVEWSDYQRVVDRYLKAYKIDKSDRRAQALLFSYQMQWAELLRHANGVNRLSKEQYHAASRAVSVDTSRFNMVEGVPHAIFDIMDTDGDNTISKAEFKQYLGVWDITDPAAMDAFAELDTDGDGSISRQEFIRAVREFFYSPDLEAPGSLFFGRLSS